MIAKHLRKLVGIGGSPLGPSPADLSPVSSWGGVGEELTQLLTEANGFYAFESALLVRPLTSASGVLGVLEWNLPDCWRSAYDGLADGILCFAEDAFGGQFCIGRDGVVSFDPETGEQEFLATTLEGWARKLLGDYEMLTGHPIAHAWQEMHGPLLTGQRLAPKLPFVFGGEFEVANLWVGDSATQMLARANVAVRIRDLPDGTPIKLTVVD